MSAFARDLPEVEVPSMPTREIRARGPGSDTESLRTAYLELLKLSLCDLAGDGTLSVTWAGEDLVFSRELHGELMKIRAGGVDWPLTGLTMVGLKRLDDLQDCVESIVRDGVKGDLIEAGAWRGGASILMRATLDSLGAHDRTVWVADSFQGFPSPNPDAIPEGARRDDAKLDDLSRVDFLAAPLKEVREHFARLGVERGTRFIPGLFEDTMPALRGRRWSIVRIDVDTYSSTRLALEALYPGLQHDGYLMLDDYGYVDACDLAVEDFRREHGITEPIEQVDWQGARWRRRSYPQVAVDEPARPLPDPNRDTGTVPRPARAHIPTVQELELESELATLRERLEAAEAELSRRRKSPFSRRRDWLRRRADRGSAAR
jgi:O-methyltransferase